MSEIGSSEGRLLRHFLASLAYRTQKALRQAPSGFGSYRPEPGVRTPAELLRHMSSVLAFALVRLGGAREAVQILASLEGEVVRFHTVLQQLGERLERGAGVEDTSAERLLQGPLCDAMTHAGQLSMLRRMAGSPVAPENFHEASVSSDNLTRQQELPRAPARHWHDAEGRPEPRGHGKSEG